MKPTFAVIAVVHNEAKLIRHFIDHHLFQGAKSILIADDDSMDGTPEIAAKAPCTSVVRYDHGEMDDAARTAYYQSLRESFIGQVDWVVLMDADEFLVPKDADQRLAVCFHGRNALTAEGWEVIQTADEPPIDLSASPLKQRRFGYRLPNYDKPIVLRPDGPERLAPGHHWIHGQGRLPPSPLFCLMHLRACDQALFLSRGLAMTARQTTANDAKGYSIQHTGQTLKSLRARWEEITTAPHVLLPTVR
jgi:glycosyltransferase involved in cell wall biosynthesis